MDNQDPSACSTEEELCNQEAMLSDLRGMCHVKQSCLFDLSTTHLHNIQLPLGSLLSVHRPAATIPPFTLACACSLQSLLHSLHAGK